MENTILTDNNLLQYYNLIEKENHEIWKCVIELNEECNNKVELLDKLQLLLRIINKNKEKKN
jgi:hypothetical protein